MLLNHQRRTPKEWDDALPSLCPDCAGLLIARRGRIVVWHWAHRAEPHSTNRRCTTAETFWHLAWKMVYRSFPGWEIEVPWKVLGTLYRLDAANLSRGKAREFVHSLSEKYVQKHLVLVGCGLDVMWIFDGSIFVADRRRPIRGGGLKHLLKPSARWLYGQVGGLVHHNDRLWKEWKADCWYPCESDRTTSMVQAFKAEVGRIESEATP